jgi:hypothetical protein
MTPETKCDLPAFPYSTSLGLTQLEYFAAHAPMREIPDWFQPKMGEGPKNPGDFHSIFGKRSDHPHKEFMKNHYSNERGEFYMVDPKNDDGFSYIKMNEDKLPKGLRKEIEEWEIAFNKYYADQKVYDQLKYMKRITQWKIYYASCMIESLCEYKNEQLTKIKNKQTS